MSTSQAINREMDSKADQATGARLFVLDLSEGRLVSMNTDGSDRKVIVTGALHPDGVGWLYVPSGLKDGPLPTHYEPLESQVENPLYSQQTNPAANRKKRPDNPYAAPHDARFPYILTTYRLTEHHTAGGMSRYLSHLSELQPELFTEVSPELAAQVGL